MNCKILGDFVGRHVTLVTHITNQPITVESSVNLFSGYFENFDDEALLLRLFDGTHAVFLRDKIIGIIENRTMSVEDPEVKSALSQASAALCSCEGSREACNGTAKEKVSQR